jgi:hypothetical protein
MVSFSVSPLDTEDELGSAKPNTVPPSRSIAVWKEKLVRVDGS